MAKSQGRNHNRTPQKQGAWTAWLLGSADSYEGYFAQSRSLALSFILIAPLLLIYELALLYYPPAQATGAAFTLRSLLSNVFRTRHGMILNITVVILLLFAVAVSARKRALRLHLIIPMVMESVVWSLCLVGVAVLFFRRLAALDAGGPGYAGPDWALKVVWSIGAGVYEEVIFRLFLTSGLCYLGFKVFEENMFRAKVFAVVVSAVLFALCHFIAPGSVPLNGPYGWLYFLFYLSSGLFFALLYTFRGLGVVVYTHVIYDVVVRIANG